jgi:hypothetical protein
MIKEFSLVFDPKIRNAIDTDQKVGNIFVAYSAGFNEGNKNL